MTPPQKETADPVRTRSAAAKQSNQQIEVYIASRVLAIETVGGAQ